MTGLLPPVDLTTLGADTPPPADPYHPIYNHVMPDEMPAEYDPVRFTLLEMNVLKLTREIQMLSQRLTLLEKRK